jgi:hypothetical protein
MTSPHMGQPPERFSLVKRKTMLAGLAFLAVPVGFLLLQFLFIEIPDALANIATPLFTICGLIATILIVYARKDTALLVTESGLIRTGWFGDPTDILWQDIEEVEMHLVPAPNSFNIQCSYRLKNIRGKTYSFNGNRDMVGLATVLNMHVLPFFVPAEIRIEQYPDRTVTMPINLRYNRSGVTALDTGPASTPLPWQHIIGLDRFHHLILPESQVV